MFGVESVRVIVSISARNERDGGFYELEQDVVFRPSLSPLELLARKIRSVDGKVYLDNESDTSKG